MSASISTSHTAETLRAAIDEHNQGIESACKARYEHGCDAFVNRGLQCPDCPKEWLLDDELIKHYAKGEA